MTGERWGVNGEGTNDHEACESPGHGVKNFRTTLWAIAIVAYIIIGTLMGRQDGCSWHVAFAINILFLQLMSFIWPTVRRWYGSLSMAAVVVLPILNLIVFGWWNLIVSLITYNAIWALLRYEDYR